MPTSRLPISARPDFTALPSDPRMPLKPAQIAALWGGNVEAMLHDCQRGAVRDALAHSTHAASNDVKHPIHGAARPENAAANAR